MQRRDREDSLATVRNKGPNRIRFFVSSDDDDTAGGYHGKGSSEATELEVSPDDQMKSKTGRKCR